MEGFLTFAGSVAVLIGLGALVEAVRHRRGGKGGSWSKLGLAGKTALQSHSRVNRDGEGL
jgi:molybdenum-dependent DNA-binding transcriptional regulator ModE